MAKKYITDILSVSDEIIAGKVKTKSSPSIMGVVTGFETIPPAQISRYVPFEEIQNTYGIGYIVFDSDTYLSIVTNGESFYENDNPAYDLFYEGSTIDFIDIYYGSGITWTLAIGPAYVNYGYMLGFQYSVVSTSDFTVPFPGLVAYGWGSPFGSSFAIQATLNIPETYTVALDNNVLDPAELLYIAVNGTKTGPPAPTQFRTQDPSVYGTNTPNGFVDVGGGYFYGNLDDGEVTQEMLDAWSPGNSVRFQWDDNPQAYAEGTIISNDLPAVGSPVSSLNVIINFTSSGSSSFHVGFWYSSFGSIFLDVSTRYKDIFTNFTLPTAATKYRSIEPFTFLSIGDEISYNLLNSSVVFENDDASFSKAITFNNETGEINYEGIVQVIRLGENGSIYSSNVADADFANSPSPYTSYQSIILGRDALSPSSGDNVVIGANARASGNGVSIGTGSISTSGFSVAVGYYSTSNYYGVAIGSNAIVNNSYGIAIGANTNASSRSIALGYTIKSMENDQVAIGVNNASSNGMAFVSGSSALTNTQTGKWYWSFASNQGPRQNSAFPDFRSRDFYKILGNSAANSIIIIDADIIITGLDGWSFGGTGKPSSVNYKILKYKGIIRKSNTNQYLYQWDLLNESKTVIFESGDGVNWDCGFEIFNSRYLNIFSNVTSVSDARYELVANVNFQVIKL